MGGIRTRIVAAGGIFLGLFCMVALTAQRGGPYGQGVVRWVSTAWLQEHLKDPNLLILDVQPNVHDYFAQHIPGAVYFNEGLLRVSDHGMPARYAPAQAIEMEFRRTGLNNDTPVVVYTGKGRFSGAGEGLGQRPPMSFSCSNSISAIPTSSCTRALSPNGARTGIIPR